MSHTRNSRAPRYPLELPVRYRRVGENHWHRSTTRNISASGILFASRAHFDFSEKLELHVRLPAHDHSQPNGIFCWAEVVRHDGKEHEGMLHAAKYLSFSLVKLATATEH